MEKFSDFISEQKNEQPYKLIIFNHSDEKLTYVKDTRLSEFGGKGLFSSSIEKELQDKSIDVAVHALKDLPAIETDGLITDTFF